MSNGSPKPNTVTQKGVRIVCTCPMNKEEYLALYQAPWGSLMPWSRHAAKDQGMVFGKPHAHGVHGPPGVDTLRFLGPPMCPVGLVDPEGGPASFGGSATMSGGSGEGTSMGAGRLSEPACAGASRSGFSSLPGLKNAEFVRYG